METMNAFALDTFNGNVHPNINGDVQDAGENSRSAVHLATVLRWPMKFALIFGYWPFVKHLVKNHAIYMFRPIGTTKLQQFSSTRGISSDNALLAQNVMVMFLLVTTVLMRKDVLLIRARVQKIHSACSIHCGGATKYRTSRAMMSLVILLLLATSRAGFEVATVVTPSFYRLEIWRASMCIIALFVWNLTIGLVGLWVVIVTGYIDILTGSLQMLNEEMSFSPRLSNSVHQFVT